MSAAKSGDLELPLPAVEPVPDGEWLLAVFEIGPHRRATSVAARASAGPESTKVVLEPRDCRRLADFARFEADRPANATERPPPQAAAPEEGEGAPRTERSLTAPPPGGAAGALGAGSTAPPAATAGS